MKRPFFLLILIVGCCGQFMAFAQVPDTPMRKSAIQRDTVTDKRPEPGGNRQAAQRSLLQVGLQYASDNVFMGRRDSLAVPYFNPSIYYFHKYGFYAGGSVSYLASGRNDRIDLFAVTAGYHYTGGNFTAGFSGTKYFFNKASYNVESQVSGYINATAEYNFQHMITAGAIAMFTLTSDPDFFSGLELSHAFSLADDRLSITPSVIGYAGTQQFYNAYYSAVRLSGMRAGSANGKGSGGQAATTNAVVQNSTRFRMLDYEFALPVHYTAGSITFLFRPQLDTPTGAADILINSQPVKEKLKPVFSWSAGVFYLF